MLSLPNFEGRTLRPHHPRSSPSLVELRPLSGAGSKELGIQGRGSCAAWVTPKGLTRCAKSRITYLDVSELTGITFVRIMSEVKQYALRGTKSPSTTTLRQRSRLADVAQVLCEHNRYIIQKRFKENHIYLLSLRYSSFFRQRRHCTHTSAC